MDRRKKVVLISFSLLCLIWGGTAFAGEPMKNKAGDILKARATDLAGNPTAITLERFKPNRPYKIGLLVPPFYNPYWVIITYGVVDDAEMAKLPKPRVLATKTYQSFDEQATHIEDVLTAGVDAILIGPLSYEGSAEMISRAAKKVPIISVAQGAKTDMITCTVESDNYEIGKVAAEFIAKESGGKAKIAMFKGPSGASWSMERVKGAKDVFAKYPNIQVVAEKWCSHERAEVLKLTEDFLTTRPDIEWTWDVVGPSGIIRALEAAGKIGKIKVATTTAMLPEIAQYMKEGKLHVMVGESAALMGRVSIQEAIRVLNGQRSVKHIYLPNPVYHPGNFDRTFDESLEWAPKDFRP